MDKREKYFRKQKRIGVLVMALACLMVIFGIDLMAAMFIGGIGLYMLFTKDMVLTDQYYFEEKYFKGEESE